MPPELLQDGQLLPACDIFSFGILMWEMLTAQHVYQGISDSQVVLQVVEVDLRPTFPSDTPSSYKDLANACTSAVPHERPSWKRIQAKLQAIQSMICPSGPDSGLVLIRRAGKARRCATLLLSAFCA